MAVAYIPFRFPGVPYVRCAFGGMGMTANRRALRDILGLAACMELTQVHGNAVLFDPVPIDDDALPTHEPHAADGHATTLPSLGLMIKTADCQPILIAHRAGQHILALHTGWRGNTIDFPGTAVARFCDTYALHPRDLRAVRGPSLGHTASEFIHFDKEWGADFAAWFDAHSRTMDLWTLTRHQLRTAGLLESCIFGIDMCTHTMHEVFFSYRRNKTSERQASVIWIGESP